MTEPIQESVPAIFDSELLAYLEGLLTPRVENPSISPAITKVERVETVDAPPPPEKPSAKVVQSQTVSNSTSESELSACPEWLPAHFAVLVFKVGQLDFAVPVEQIRGAWEIDEAELMPPPESQQNILGVLELADGDWLVVDTAELILPGKSLTRGYRWVLLTSLGTLALACDSVEAERDVQASQVRWRQSRHSRPWLLGMLAGDPPCPLIDVDVLVADLQANL